MWQSLGLSRFVVRVSIPSGEWHYEQPMGSMGDFWLGEGHESSRGSCLLSHHIMKRPEDSLKSL